MDMEAEINGLKRRIAALEAALQAILQEAEANVVVHQHREFVERIRASREAEAP